MRQKLLPVFLLIVCWFMYVEKVSAQTNSCAVKMEVTRYNTESLINGASVKAINQETKKVYLSTNKNGMPYFAKLPEGDYRVTVSKAGFMQSAEDYNLDCTDREDEGIDWSIELYPGSSKKTVKLYAKIPPRRPDVRTVVGEPFSTVDSSPRGEVTEKAGEINALDEPPPAPEPNPSQPPKAVPKIVSMGVVNGKAVNLVKPPYPPAAAAVRASGAVNVQVTIDEKGNVISASAVSGHALLRAAAESAARASKFYPTLLSGQPVKVTGVVIYNFTAQ